MKPLAVLLLLLFGLWYFLYPAPTRTIPEQFTAAERAYYAERHRYHGIGGNVVDLRTGERTFERDGKTCRL